MGNRNPVKLVNSVLARKTAVQRSRGLAFNMPQMTTNPVARPTRLRATCTKSSMVVVPSDPNLPMAYLRPLVVQFQYTRPFSGRVWDAWNRTLDIDVNCYLDLYVLLGLRGLNKQTERPQRADRNVLEYKVAVGR